MHDVYKNYFFFSTIVYSDLSKIAPENYVKNITLRVTDIKAVDSPADRSFLIQALESAYRFTLGSVAGGTYVEFLFMKTVCKSMLCSCWCHCRISY